MAKEKKITQGLSFIQIVNKSCARQFQNYSNIDFSALVNCIRRKLRPATHPDLIGISRFFSANLEVSRFPDFTCGNPGFLFRFGRLTLLHGPCHQAHQAWAKNKFYDRLNPLHNATQGYPRLTMAPASHA